MYSRIVPRSIQGETMHMESVDANVDLSTPKSMRTLGCLS
jgi:hypothetical protein